MQLGLAIKTLEAFRTGLKPGTEIDEALETVLKKVKESRPSHINGGDFKRGERKNGQLQN